MRLKLAIDDDLLAEAFNLTDVATTRELVELALREFIAARKPRDMADLKGKIRFADGYDYKSLREGR